MWLDETMMGTVVGGLVALGGVYLQSFLTQKNTSKQSLHEAKRVVYSQLLSALISEDEYPEFDYSGNPLMYQQLQDEYNVELGVWRKNRKKIKGLATEALLLVTNEKLKKKLHNFITSPDPDFPMNDLEDLIREDINFSY